MDTSEIIVTDEVEEDTCVDIDYQDANYNQNESNNDNWNQELYNLDEHFQPH